MGPKQNAAAPKPAAAKSGAKAAAGGEPPAKVPATESTFNKKQLSGFFGYALSDKCKDDKTKEMAASMKKEYASLDKPMASMIPAKFMETRKTKDFSWHKNFKESLTARKEEEHTVKQGYLTLMLP